MAVWFLIAMLVFLVAIVVSVVLVLKSSSYLPRIILALLLAPVVLFCVYGFMATFEPMDPVKQWSFRIGYAVLGAALAAAILLALIRWPDRRSGSA